LQAKFGRFESENLIALEQVRQDFGQRLANLRSQLWEERGVADQEWGAVQDELANQSKALASELEVSRKHSRTEHSEQQALLSQVQEFAQTQEARLQRHGIKANARHEEASSELQELQQEINNTARAQASSIASMQQDLRKAEIAAACESSAARDTLSGELREEVNESRELVQQMHAAQDVSIHELQLQIDQVHMHGKSRASQSEAEAQDISSALAEFAQETSEKQTEMVQKLRSFEQDVFCAGQAELSMELLTSREACTEACHRVAMECAALERKMVVEQHAATERLGDVLAQQQAATERTDIVETQQQAATERLGDVVAQQHAIVERLGAVATQQQAFAERIDSVEDATVVATQADVKTHMDSACTRIDADVKLLRAEVVTMLDDSKVNKVTSLADVEMIRSEFAERCSSLQQSLARLESSSSSSAIGAAAASAAVDVRNEVVEMVSLLHERQAAADEQLLFIRGEVAPDALRSALWRDITTSVEQIIIDQLARFRKRWGGDVERKSAELERKLDCVVQSVRALHLKSGLLPPLASPSPPSGQLTEYENLS
jgi:hypothetical protein